MNEQESLIAGVSRVSFIAFAVICGLMASIGIVAATYAFMASPGISEMPIYVDGRLHRTESKFIYLFSPVLFQLFVFAATMHPVLKWKKYTRKWKEQPDFFIRRAETLEGPRGPVNMMRVLQIAGAGFCVFGAHSLWTGLSRSSDVLSQA